MKDKMTNPTHLEGKPMNHSKAAVSAQVSLAKLVAKMAAGLEADSAMSPPPPDPDAPTPDAEQQRVMAILRSEPTYQNVRLLKDGTIACTADLIHTRAVLIGCDENCWEHRFCYENRALASVAVHLLETAESEPLPGYVSSRHAPGAEHTLTFKLKYAKPSAWA